MKTLTSILGIVTLVAVASDVQAQTCNANALLNQPTPTKAYVDQLATDQGNCPADTSFYDGLNAPVETDLQSRGCTWTQIPGLVKVTQLSDIPGCGGSAATTVATMAPAVAVPTPMMTMALPGQTPVLQAPTGSGAAFPVHFKEARLLAEMWVSVANYQKLHDFMVARLATVDPVYQVSDDKDAIVALKPALEGAKTINKKWSEEELAASLHVELRFAQALLTAGCQRNNVPISAANQLLGTLRQDLHRLMSAPSRDAAAIKQKQDDLRRAEDSLHGAIKANPWDCQGKDATFLQKVTQVINGLDWSLSQEAKPYLAVAQKQGVNPSDRFLQGWAALAALPDNLENFLTADDIGASQQMAAVGAQVVNNGKVKEVLVSSGLNGKYVTVLTPEGRFHGTAEVLSDGTLVLKDSKGTVIARFPPGSAFRVFVHDAGSSGGDRIEPMGPTVREAESLSEGFSIPSFIISAYGDFHTGSSVDTRDKRDFNVVQQGFGIGIQVGIDAGYRMIPSLSFTFGSSLILGGRQTTFRDETVADGVAGDDSNAFTVGLVGRLGLNLFDAFGVYGLARGRIVPAGFDAGFGVDLTALKGFRAAFELTWGMAANSASTAIANGSPADFNGMTFLLLVGWRI